MAVTVENQTQERNTTMVRPVSYLTRRSSSYIHLKCIIIRHIPVPIKDCIHLSYVQGCYCLHTSREWAFTEFVFYPYIPEQRPHQKPYRGLGGCYGGNYCCD